MDHRINTHTIARTPVTIRFPRLCLKKKLKISPNANKECDKENSSHISLLHKDIINKSTEETTKQHQIFATPPFVTKGRPTVKDISLFRFNSDTDDSAQNSVNDSRLSEGIASNSINTTPLQELNVYESSNKGDPLKNSTESLNEKPKSNDSSKCDITPESVNIMDALYGNIWRSTPGLFKKSKQRSKAVQDDEDDFNDKLICGLNSLDINASTNLLDKKEKMTKEGVNEPIIKLSSPAKELDRFIIKCRSDDSSSESDSPDDFLTKKKINNKNPISSSNDEETVNYKPIKLNFNTSDLDPDKNTNDIGSIKEKTDKHMEDFVKTNDNIPDSKKKRYTKKNTSTKETGVKVNDAKSTLNGIKQYGFMASLADNIPSWRRHEKAKYYRENFKSKKEELADVLFKLFNKNVFDSKIYSNLPIVWSSTLTKTAGRAHNRIIKSKGEDGNKFIERRSRVELSIKVLDTAQRLRDTLAHELCHVAVWIIDGQLAGGHGPYWKTWVARVLKRYPELGSIPVCHSLDIHFKYSYKCTKCGYKIDRHSKSIDTTKKRCGYCYGSLECILNKKMKDGLIVSTPVQQKKKETTGFALYVKENYGMVRGNNTPHKETMKFLGRQYAKMKLQTKEDKEDARLCDMQNMKQILQSKLDRDFDEIKRLMKS